MVFHYLVHPSTGMVDGTGTANCDPCLVAGLTGTVSFSTTVVGHAVTHDGLVFGVYEGGTWQITGATGDLAAISGAGTWTEGTGHMRVFAGTILLSTDRLITATGKDVSTTEGGSFTAPVATFTDPDTNAAAAEYSARIDWGDTTTSAGTVSGSGGSFTVSGTHTYAEEGTHSVTVTITDVDAPSNTATAISTARVADAVLSGTCLVPVTASTAFAGPTATFTDQSSTGTLKDFSATINWGDGSNSPGVITGGEGTATYTVSGTHGYTPGFYTITTMITDVGGRSLTAACPTQTFIIPPSTAGCDIDGAGKIVATNGDKARFVVDFGSETGSENDQDNEGDQQKTNGADEELPENVQTYRDRGPKTSLSFTSTANLAATCNDKKSGSIYGTGLVDGKTPVSFIIDVTTGNAEEDGNNDREGPTAANYRIRLSNGYDSGMQNLRSGNVSVHLESDEEGSQQGRRGGPQ